MLSAVRFCSILSIPSKEYYHFIILKGLLQKNILLSVLFPTKNSLEIITV